VGLGALGTLFAFFGVRDLAAALAAPIPGYLALYLLLGCLARFGFSLRWFLVARALGPVPPLSRFVAARLGGDAAGALVPAGSVGGDPLRILLLYGRGVPGATASAGVALDRFGPRRVAPLMLLVTALGAIVFALGHNALVLAIGRALALNPYLLILDEPTEGIQPSIIKDIEQVIRMLAKQGRMAILLVEQYYDFARSLADQYLLMERGEIVQRGRGEDMDADGVRARVAV